MGFAAPCLATIRVIVPLPGWEYRNATEEEAHSLKINPGDMLYRHKDDGKVLPERPTRVVEQLELEGVNETTTLPVVEEQLEKITQLQAHHDFVLSCNGVNLLSHW